jgi:hypothetical protein
MGRLRLLAALLASALALAAPPRAAAEPPAADVRALWRETRLAEIEAELAQKPKSYFVLDLAARRVSLKARGMTLKELPVADFDVWGRLVVGPTSLVQKDALARPAIKPGEEKSQETLDQQLLEVADMPAEYRIGLGRGVAVDVFSTPAGGFRASLRHRARLWRWRLARLPQALRDREERRESTSLFLVLAPADARSLYWMLYEGIEGIVVSR